ncbi:S-type pyocin family protein [Brevundimonas sp. S30B]|uniref:S-type pyocin family protein n=1 Tax=unclassified Brevundimonas TaxID=2622653 RepID=UPI0010718FE5|nr:MULTISPECIES: S-type pyocin family protein [unclassified Brevundimonas]QBX37163.1 S-type pyocin family protein [Brevundimonas sp. MF30-B]TFW04042.1 S-type pyocin family protein [Brevundimonas sp. S30B]
MRVVMCAAAAALFVAGCDNGASAVETRERSGSTPGEGATLTATASFPEPQAAPVEKTAVTANRRETADAKVQRLYERNGAAFGARSADDYLKKVQDFTTRTPRDAETVKRPNGDTLIYQASTNTFAVVARDGTPRTMFKPNDGPTYWAEQKERAPTFGQRRSGQ